MSRTSKWWCAALLLVAAAAYAEDSDRFELQFKKDFEFRGGRVSIDHSFGAVRISTEEGPEVHVRATIRASDPDFGRQIRVIAEQSGGGVSVRTEYPSHAGRNHGDFSYSVDYRITVPPSASVEVKNRFGSIEASDLSGPSTFISSYGSIRLRDVKRPERIENSFGSIDVRDSASVSNITNKYGSVQLQGIGGDIAVNNGFGSIQIQDVHGNADIATQNGSVTVHGVDGSLKVSSSFGSVVASDIKGHADIRNQNGRIDVVDVGGNAILRTSFASIRAERIKGKADIENANGSVQLEDVGSDATVRTSFASVFASGVRGAIDINNQNGAIGVSQVGPSCRPISLHTSFSSIKVAVPSKASYSVNARTTFGRISSELPITTHTNTEDTLVGNIGSGGCKMELVNSNGSITIDRE